MRKTSQRWAAPLCLVAGLGLLVQSTTLPVGLPWESRLGPALVALGFAVVFWGLLTVQNVVQLIMVLRGLTPANKGGAQ